MQTSPSTVLDAELVISFMLYLKQWQSLGLLHDNVI